jgi:type I restriction enzyme S subunit
MFVSREWGVGKLGEEIDVKSGQVDPRESIYAGMICVGGDNIESNTGRLLGLKTAKEVGAKSGKYLFDEGDILYSKIRPYLNKVVLTDFKGICSADIYPLKPKRKLTREFLTFILRSKDFLQYADKHSSRTSIPKINREALAEYKIILPPIDMQEQFSRTFQQVERLKTLLVKSASELDNQFNALMQRYFD